MLCSEKNSLLTGLRIALVLSFSVLYHKEIGNVETMLTSFSVMFQNAFFLTWSLNDYITYELALLN